MDCETVRQLMDEGQWNASMAAHLEACAKCREEAEFARRIAAAVASLPRARAPERLIGLVMADLQPSAGVRHPVRRLPALVLRPWEVGWLGAACLLLVVLVPLAFREALPTAATLLSSWLSGSTASLTSAAGAGSLLQVWALGLFASLGAAQNVTRPGTEAPITWLCGAAAFALAFLLLLSWNGGAGSRDPWEDAHA